eukprot:CAMPEP_0172411082 /NCGR_PEP_ID=MMETSP1061-20121228/77216_1 /TAXON_ID=37318 /ORGANISM="Pseudo-nitzschia pungens, Strain cf. pungens" /LENGTH=51 /DNA_ID=CAMNT_0013147289 /DNA_START=97 /DNA_END=249 /DNA_ORIENTATION=+
MEDDKDSDDIDMAEFDRFDDWNIEWLSNSPNISKQEGRSIGSDAVILCANW